MTRVGISILVFLTDYGYFAILATLELAKESNIIKKVLEFSPRPIGFFFNFESKMN